MVDTVDRSLQARERALQTLKFHLERAHNRMKQMADKHRTDREYEEGDWVYIKLQPYRQTSMGRRPSQKLAARYYGPYKILKRIGAVAYTVELPEVAQIHHTFHVFMLKMYYGNSPNQHSTTNLTAQATEDIPEAVIDKRMVKKHNKAEVQWLVKWKNQPPEDAKWIPAE